jgi:hypothetical protein
MSDCSEKISGCSEKMSDCSERMRKQFEKLQIIPIEVILLFTDMVDMEKCSGTSSMEDIVNNLQLPWNYCIISKREDIDLHQLEQLHTVCPGQKWNRKKATLATFCFDEIPSPYIDKDTIKHIIQYSSPEHITDIIKRNTNTMESLENIEETKTIITEKYRVSDELIIQNAISNISHFLCFELLTHFVSWECISYNPGFSWNLYEKEIDIENRNTIHYCPPSILYKLKDKNINWEKITIYNNFNIITENPELPWEMQNFYDIIDSNEEDLIDMTLFINMTPKLPWDMEILTVLFPWNIINTNPTLPWDTKAFIKKEVSRHENPSIHIISLFHSFFDMKRVTEIYDINIISDTIHVIPWDTKSIFIRTNIPFSIFLQKPKEKWLMENIFIKTDIQRKKFQEKVDIDNTPLPTDIQGILYEYIF